MRNRSVEYYTGDHKNLGYKSVQFLSYCEPGQFHEPPWKLIFTSVDLRALDYIVGCQILFSGSMKGYSDAHPGMHLPLWASQVAQW